MQGCGTGAWVDGERRKTVDLNPKLLLQKGMTWGVQIACHGGLLHLVTYPMVPPTSGRLWVCPRTASANLTTHGDSQEAGPCIPLLSALEPAQGIGQETKGPAGSLSAYSVCLVGLFFFSAEPPFGLPLSIFEPSGLL